MITTSWVPKTPLDLTSLVDRIERYGPNLLSAVAGGYLYRTTECGYPYRLRQLGDGRIEVGAETEQAVVVAVPESRVRLGETLPYAPLEEVAAQVAAVNDQLRVSPGFRVPTNPAVLETLVSSVCSQQVNLRWATTLRNRLVRHYGTTLEMEGVTWWRFPSVRSLAEANPADLRDMQFSTRKASYIVGIAQAVKEGRLDDIAQAGNETVIRRLTRLRGVGRWTAEWFLARCLVRPDVVAAGDLGVRKVVSRYVMGAEVGEVHPEANVRAAVESWGDGTNWAVHLLLERWSADS